MACFQRKAGFDPLQAFAVFRSTHLSGTTRKFWTFRAGSVTVVWRTGPEPLLMSAVSRTDGPGTAAIVRLALWVVVAALAEGAADGMNRREIDDVETHLRDVGQALFAIRQRTVSAGLLSRGAGKELVPGTESRAHRIDNNGELAVRLGSETLVDRKST